MVSPTNGVIETISVQVFHKSPLILRKLPLVTFGKLIIGFAENFSNNSNPDDSGISLPVFPSRTNLKMHNISVTPKMVKKIIMNIELPKAPGPDSIPMVVLKNYEPDLSYILAEIFNKCLEGSCFPDYWKVSSMVLYLRTSGKGLQLKTTAMLVFFLWLVKSLKNVKIIGLFII